MELQSIGWEGETMTARDDVSGAQLNAEMVLKAREVETQFFKRMGVYEYATRQDMLNKGCKPVRTKWVDVNKGDTSRPLYRSRLVAMEFNTHTDHTMYASTPPIEAMRCILSRAATT